MSGPLSRRRLLRVAGAGLSAGAAMLLSGCGDDDPGQAGAKPATEIDLLNAVLELEHVSVAAYRRAAGRLDGELGALARRFRDHEREHVERLGLVVRGLGGVPRGPRAASELDLPRGRKALLRFAVDLEDAAIASYIDAIPRLATPEVRATAASILTTEAEQLAVLRDALGEEPVPSAFVEGRSR